MFQPHRLENQSGYPANGRYGNIGDRIRRNGAALNMGNLTVIPYHLRPVGEVGRVPIGSVYAPDAIYQARGFAGQVPYLARSPRRPYPWEVE